MLDHVNLPPLNLDQTKMSLRDRIIRGLTEFLNANQISHLHLSDLCDTQRESGYIPVKRKVELADHHPPVTLNLPNSLYDDLDEYINSEDPEEEMRPFLDYRPNIGRHLFPSARTGKGIHLRVIQRVIEKHPSNGNPNNIRDDAVEMSNDH